MKSAIYHLHIPRTAGTYIFSQLSERFITAIENNNLVPKTVEQQKLLTEIKQLTSYEIYDKFLKPESLPDKNKQRFMFLSGHYAINPLIENTDKYEVFSVVRDPYEHTLSSAAFTCRESGIEFTEDYLDGYVRGEFDAVYNAPFCSGAANIQTKMLTCRLVNLSGSEITDSYGRPSTNVTFIESDLEQVRSVKDIFDGKNIFTFDDRQRLNMWLGTTIYKMFQFSIGEFSNTIINSAERYGLDLNTEQKRIVRTRNELDFELYEYANEIPGHV